MRDDEAAEHAGGDAQAGSDAARISGIILHDEPCEVAPTSLGRVRPGARRTERIEARLASEVQLALEATRPPPSQRGPDTQRPPPSQRAPDTQRPPPSQRGPDTQRPPRSQRAPLSQRLGAGPATERPPPSTPAPVSDRRGGLRVACAVEMFDVHNRTYLAEDVAAGGIRFTGPVAPLEGPVPFLIPLPSAERNIEVVARPVWVRPLRNGRWEVGARIDGSPPQLDRFKFMVNALAERQDLGDLGWIAFALLDRPKDVRAELSRLRGIEVGPAAARAARRCAEIAPRPPFLWQWAHEAIRITTLASVDPAWLARVEHLKLCAAIFFTAVDDVADELRDPDLFDQILARVFRRRADSPVLRGESVGRIRSLEAIWRYLGALARSLPRYRELAGFLEFDCGTFLHGVSHSLLLHATPEAHCAEEIWTAAFMPMFADLDLMCSPGFDLADLGPLRGVVLEAQQMVIIANALGTWERELRTGDHSSAVVTAALRKGVLRAVELRDGTAAELLIARIRASDVEAGLMLRWELHWHSIEQKRGQISSVDITSYLGGLENVFELQMMSRGLV
jgi:hypothetical protein